MSFLLPLGLLGSLSIPVLILIYIIKPKYREQIVPSTYIWHLSLKYQKKKIPLQWIKISLVFILQMLILGTLTLMLMRPFVHLRTVSGEKVIILDASAGMLAEEGGTTRFERAVDAIQTLVDRKDPEDRITVILASSEPSYLVRRADTAEQVMLALESVACTYGVANIEEAMSLATGVLSENDSAEVILYTDRDYESPGYVTVENMAENEWNAAVLSWNATLRDGYYEFAAELASYGRDAELAVSLHVDGELLSTRTVTLLDGVVTPVIWWNEPEISRFAYSTATVSVEVHDDFACDNALRVYGDGRERFIELVSASPHMVSTALHANPGNNIYQASPGTSEGSPVYYEGYDLYVFEGDVPKRLPTDGGILLLNPQKSVAGIKLKQKQNGAFTAEGTNGISHAHLTLMKGITPESIHISRYSQVLSYDEDIYEVLMTVNGDPVLLAGRVEGVPVVVLLFDIHYSDLPLLLEFPMLLSNICDYAAPPTLTERACAVDDRMHINPKPNAVSVELICSPAEGSEPTVTTHEVFPIDLTVTRPGTYTVVQHLENGKVRTDEFFVRVDAGESDFAARGEVLAGDEYRNPSLDAADDPIIRRHRTELLPYIALGLLLLLMIEWGVQYREQY